MTNNFECVTFYPESDHISSQVLCCNNSILFIELPWPFFFGVILNVWLLWCHNPIRPSGLDWWCKDTMWWVTAAKCENFAAAHLGDKEWKVYLLECCFYLVCCVSYIFLCSTRHIICIWKKLESDWSSRDLHWQVVSDIYRDRMSSSYWN